MSNDKQPQQQPSNPQPQREPLHEGEKKYFPPNVERPKDPPTKK